MIEEQIQKIITRNNFLEENNKLLAQENKKLKKELKKLCSSKKQNNPQEIQLTIDDCLKEIKK